MEVAEEIGISQAQVSRLEKSALKQLKKICIMQNTKIGAKSLDFCD